MADTALRRRDSSGTKLKDSIRQLRRYLDGDLHSERILIQKCDKIDVDREELIAKHHLYGERAGLDLDNEDMRNFIETKIDEAVDIVDEATLLMEKMRSDTDQEKVNSNEDMRKQKEKLETTTARLQADSFTRLTLQLIGNLDKLLVTDNPCQDDAAQVEIILHEIKNKEEVLIKSWNHAKTLIDNEEELQVIVVQEENILSQITDRCIKGMSFVTKYKSQISHVIESRSANSDTMRLQRMNPPRFSGDIRDYARFQADFQTIVVSCYPNTVHQVYIMKENCLVGEARNLVRNLDKIEDIWERLSQKYGDTIEIVDAVIKDLQNITIQHNNQDQGIIYLIETLEKGIQDLTAIGMKKEIANAYTVKLIERKLPRRVMLNWLEEEEKIVVEGEVSDSRFDKLFKFLKKERKRTEKIIQQTKDRGRERDSQKSRQTVNLLNKGNNESTRKYNNCLIHPNGSHLTRKCKDFLSKSIEERRQLVKDTGGCKLCLSLSHVGKVCPWETKWNPCGVDDCKEFHSRLVHGATALNSTKINNHIMHSNIKRPDSEEDHKTLLLMQGILTDDNEVFTFWDNGSSISLVTKYFARKNKLKGVNVSYELVTVGNIVRHQNTMLYDVPIIDRNGNTHIIKAYEIDEICQDIAFIDRRIVKLFQNLKFEDIVRPKKRIDLLIGMNYISLHPTVLETKGNLVLLNSLFGTGKLIGGQHELINGIDKLNAFTKIVAYSTYKNVEVNKSRNGIDFFTAENFGVNVLPRCNRCKSCKDCTFEVNQLSKIEQKELEVIRNNLKLDPVNNVWRTEYPYKYDPSILEDNREQALARLIKTENRLIRNEDVCKQYRNQFKDFVKRGIFRELSNDEIISYKGPVSYITHQEVFKEDSSSTPIRLVSHSSLKNKKGISLNDILMKGPNSLSDLFSVQLRFRTHICAVVGDIRKMYHSIKTTEKERHLRRLLWRDMKRDEDPKTYGIETVNFGDRPAAAISSVAIKETAELFKNIDENASQKIVNDTYVDDITTGESSHERAEVLMKNIERILLKGGFHIKGFVRSGDKSKEILQLLGSGEVGRVLGIAWDPSSDKFSVKVRINLSKKFKGVRKAPDVSLEKIPSLLNAKLTKRMLLGVTNSCYDPLGLLVPITIQLKIELRELYRKDLNLNWDDDIPAENKNRWIAILQLAREAEVLRFERCITPYDAKGDPELIVFNDGAPSAMCTAAYIRWQLECGEFRTQLIAAKARVTPLERVTIPRIEMQSAVLGVRLAKTIIGACGLSFKDIIHISDSKCTIATLAKDSTVLKEYMGNRVAEITNHTNISQWFYVKSASNIADLGTRPGATIEEIQTGSDWQLGPQWLRQKREEWPVSQDVSQEQVPKEEMITKMKLNCYTTKNNTLFDPEKFMSKSYSFLMRVTARVYNIFRKRSFKNSEILVDDLESAEKYWLQRSMILTSKKFENGSLESLRPKVDENGLIVLSSRAIKGMRLNYDRDTFPILTNADPVAYLWMKEVHCEDHSGITRTVAKSRRKFWIIKARKVAQKVKDSCFRCKLLDKKLAMQQMSPLPESRLATAPVFHTTSIDLFGPLMIRDAVKKRVKMKVWGFIATCAVTRAIYLDITDSYNTDSIMQTLRKFITLRGYPGEIISDQGSQLMAASKDIAELTQNWDWSKVRDWATKNKVKWTTIPAEGQHQNGLSESLIKSVKRSIKHIVGENVLTFSELQLVFYEIGNIINSRPIGVLSGSDPDEPKPITPNDLLLGRSSNEVPQGPFSTKVSLTRRFLFIQSLINDWWCKWYDSVLPTLVPSYKWQQKYRNVKVGDICLIRYKAIRSTYKLGRVVEVKLGEDGLVRTVRLKYKLPGEKVFRFVDRAIQGIAVIVPFEEQ